VAGQQDRRRSLEDEIRLRRADGEYRWFLIRTVRCSMSREHRQVVRNEYGTSRSTKRAEEKLKRSERQLAEAQRISQCRPLGARYRWRRDYLLRRDLQDFGLPPHDVMRNFEQMLHAEDRPLHAGDLPRVARRAL